MNNDTKAAAPECSETPADEKARRERDADLDQALGERDKYHEWADILAENIALYFGADIGEHNNLNLPWAEALEVIEHAINSKPEASAATQQEGEVIAWIVFAEHEGQMIPQYPAASSESEAKIHAGLYGQTLTEVRALYTRPAPASSSAAPSQTCDTDEFWDKVMAYCRGVGLEGKALVEFVDAWGEARFQQGKRAAHALQVGEIESMIAAEESIQIKVALMDELAALAAPAASPAVLTDADIDQMARRASLDGSMCVGQRSDYWRNFARAIERHITGQAGGGVDHA